MAVAIPRFPPRYERVAFVARGGMGEVFRAHDTTLGRDVAIKVLDTRWARDREVGPRFAREARAAARLSGHGGSVTIYDVGECEGRPYIVMEYFPGGSVEERLHAGQLPLQLVLRWLDQTGEALDAAHAAGVVHRDVKPGNLLLDTRDDVHVADFGVASAAGLATVTRTGTILGTAGYLAPEQASGARATAASDRYAFAVVAFELLAGRRPFARQSPTAEALAHAHERPPSLRALRPDLPRSLDAVFQRALAKEPAERFPSCGGFVAALHDALARADAPTRALAPPDAERPRLHRRRRRLGLPLVVLGTLLVAGAAAAALLVPTGGGPRREVVTVRVAGEAHTITVTAPPAAAPASRPSPLRPHTENNRAYALIRRGAYAAAVPPLRRVVAALRGRGPADPYEGYANYNLGFALLQLGRCSEALAPLRRAEALEPGNAFVRRALAWARAC